MSRSKWKIKQDFSLNRNFFFSETPSLLSRNKIVLESFLDRSFKVYNGKDFKSFKITRARVGFKAGEFSFTRSSRKKTKKSFKRASKKK
jgi:ribosomal protein S19